MAIYVFAAAALLATGQPVAIAQPVIERQRSVTAAQARHDVCYILAAGPAYLNLADCLSFDNAPESVFRTEVCNFLRETGQLEAYGFASHSGCIRFSLVK